MPSFIFEITHDGQSCTKTKLDLPNKKAAWEEATRCAGETLRDLDGKLKLGTEWRIDVTDSSRKPIFTLRCIAEDYG
jgi:Domain of unknown function (DUF6894)